MSDHVPDPREAAADPSPPNALDESAGATKLQGRLLRHIFIAVDAMSRATDVLTDQVDERLQLDYLKKQLGIAAEACLMAMSRISDHEILLEDEPASPQEIAQAMDRFQASMQAKYGKEVPHE